MKRGVICIVLMGLLFFQVLSSVKKIGSSEELKEMEINCHPDYSIIIEFPKDVNIQSVILQNEKAKWVVDYDLNLLWAQPDSFESPKCVFIVNTDLYKDIQLKLRVEKDSSKLIHSIVLKENAFELMNEVPEKRKIEVNEEKVEKKPSQGIKLISKEIEEPSKETESERILEEQKKNEIPLNKINTEASRTEKLPFELETYFSLSAGSQSFQKSSFMMEGEVIVAAKNSRGLFFQGAGKVLVNKMISQYGFSVGAGFEPIKLGFFLFGDLLLHKFGEEFNSTTHFQIRPAIRYRLSDKVHLSAFCAIPFGAWQYTGVEVPGEPGFGYYNKSLTHAGIDLSVYLSKMFIDLRTLIAEGSAFGIDLKAGYEVIRNIFVTVNYMYQTTGDYDYMDDISNTSRWGVGLTYSMINFEDRERNRIIFRPDYPMVVVRKKEMDEDEVNGTPAIVLAGDPIQGYAPLSVNFTTTISGFDNNTLELTWYFNTTYSAKGGNTNTYDYNMPGTYTVWIDGKDGKGRAAQSNRVQITVLKADPNTRFIVKTSCGDNGYIQPMGDIKVSPGDKVSVSFGGDDGFGVASVQIDGENIDALSSPYVFDNVQKDRTIHVEFGAGIVNKYDIESSVDSGSGTISPAGTTSVEEGASQEYDISPADGWSIQDVVVDGSSVGVPEKYVFENVKENHIITASFSEIPPTTYTISASSGPNGAISPNGDTEVVEGSDITFTISPNDGYEIDTLTVDGSSTSPNDGNDKYKFTAVTEPHTIHVTFKRIVYQVTTSVVNNEGGTITASQEVYWGDDLEIVASPLSSHQVKEMILNGASIGAVETVTLNNIKADQVVSVEFEIKKYMIYASVRGSMGTVTPTSAEVEHGSNATINFIPEDQHKQAVRYWVNGTQYNDAGCTSYTFNNVQADREIEVEFDWKYYDIDVTLTYVGTGASGHIDPGTGRFTYQAGSNYTFNFFTDNAYTEITGLYVNGNSKPTGGSWKFYNLDADQTLEVVMERPELTLEVRATGCNVSIGCSAGGSGPFYTVRTGDSITFDFTPGDPSEWDYYLGGWTETDGNFWTSMPSSYTINPVTMEGNSLTVKCVQAGDPPPYAPKP